MIRGRHDFLQRLEAGNAGGEGREGRNPTDGQLNLAYFELLAGIYNEKGKQVGLCMVELLPGARNPQSKINPINMFKKV